jgi:hypothetical protein
LVLVVTENQAPVHHHLGLDLISPLLHQKVVVKVVKDLVVLVVVVVAVVDHHQQEQDQSQVVQEVELPVEQIQVITKDIPVDLDMDGPAATMDVVAVAAVLMQLVEQGNQDQEWLFRVAMEREQQLLVQIIL